MKYKKKRKMTRRQATASVCHEKTIVTIVNRLKFEFQPDLEFDKTQYKGQSSKRTSII